MEKRVTTVACEAAYVVLCDISLGALSTRVGLVFLRPELSSMRVDMFGDNEGPKAIADNLDSTLRSKHNNAKLSFLRGLIRMGEVSISHVGIRE